MKTILFTGDFLFHSIEYLKKSLWEFDLLIPVVNQAISNAKIITNLQNNKGENFSRDKFYSLGGVKKAQYWYQEYNINNFNKDQMDYLNEFFNEDTIIIGFELYKNLSDLLTKFGCQVIDMAFHSYKLFDDLTFGFATNNKNIYNILLKYQIPKDKFYFYANYWKLFMAHNNMIQDSDLQDNSVLFIGQTLKDKSVEKNGKFLNVTDFEIELKQLSNKYSKIYYLPHPMLGKKRKIIYDWIKKSPYIELLPNRSTYGLLASDKIKKVIGISTSVLYEAQYFNKEIEYLYKPLFDIDSSFEDYSYISILNDYFNPKFWADILSPVCQIKENVSDINYFENSHNKVRNIANLYWGYAQLDPIKRIPNVEQSIKNLFIKYIAPKF